MERSGRHPPKAATVVIRPALVSEETGSAFHPRGVLYAVIHGNNVQELRVAGGVAQGRFQLNMKGAERGGPRISATSDLIMPKGTCAELIALSVLCCMLAMSRFDRQYSSTGVIGEGKNAKRTEMEDKINDESKKPSTHTYYRYAARYARARKNATETCKGGRKKRPVIIWCEQLSDNAKRCLCRAKCPALCWALVDVTF